MSPCDSFFASRSSRIRTPRTMPCLQKQRWAFLWGSSPSFPLRADGIRRNALQEQRLYVLIEDLSSTEYTSIVIQSGFEQVSWTAGQDRGGRPKACYVNDSENGKGRQLQDYALPSRETQTFAYENAAIYALSQRPRLPKTRPRIGTKGPSDHKSRKKAFSLA